MVLLFRIVVILIGSLFRRRIDILGESVLSFRVWPTDMDLNFHLNDGRYVSLAGLGRVDLMLRSGILRLAMRQGWYPVVGATMIRYRREIRSFERFELRSRVVGWDEKWVYFEHRFEKGDEMAAVGYARGVFRNRKGAVPTSEALALMGNPTSAPVLPDVVQRWRDANIP